MIINKTEYIDPRSRSLCTAEDSLNAAVSRRATARVE